MLFRSKIIRKRHRIKENRTKLKKDGKTRIEDRAKASADFNTERTELFYH